MTCLQASRHRNGAGSPHNSLLKLAYRMFAVQCRLDGLRHTVAAAKSKSGRAKRLLVAFWRTAAEKLLSSRGHTLSCNTPSDSQLPMFAAPRRARRQFFILGSVRRWAGHRRPKCPRFQCHYSEFFLRQSGEPHYSNLPPPCITYQNYTWARCELIIYIASPLVLSTTF